MTIYRIRTDTNNVQTIIPTNEKFHEQGYFIFDCFSKTDIWNEILVYIFNPKITPKNFYAIGNSGGFAFDKKSLEIFQDIFEMCGEILPMQVEHGPKLYMLNVLDCRNGLNYDTTQWDLYDDGSKGRILKFGFHKERILNESSIFKIPEVSKTHVFSFSGIKDKEGEFYGLYKKHRLTGLIFEELYKE